MLGAGCLTALAALRSGAGLVTLAVPESLNLIAQQKVNNAVMTLPLPETKDQTISSRALRILVDFSSKCQAVAVGPGISEHPSSQKLVLTLIENINLPMVIDADGLNALVKKLSTLDKTPYPRILTPHPGEMRRLTSRPLTETNRVTESRAFTAAHRSCVLVLKGHRTLISQPGQTPKVNLTGNVGLATAGSGDVLTGIITGLLAQGVSAFEAAKWGAHIHGLTADLAVRKIPRATLIATDLIDKIPAVLKKLGAK